MGRGKAVSILGTLDLMDPQLCDKVERRLMDLGGLQRDKGQDSMPGGAIRHLFTPGIYVREITMSAGLIVTSKIHKTQHPYVVSAGKVSVLTPAEGVQLIEAPFTGITVPGTRRILEVHEETVWTTFHATEETDLAKLEELLLEPYENPLLEGGT